MDTSEDPHCMHCREEMDHVFIMANLNKSWFLGDYRKRRKELLWERERARLPEAMERVERELEADRLTAQAAEARKRCLELKRQAKAFAREETALLQAAARVKGGEGRNKAPKTAFLLGCSWSDCRGYLNEDYSCKLCQRKTCRKCLSPEDDSHQCSPDALATAALLRKETKPCPGCGEGIQKTDGCDQMWCLSCHTAFSWRTGEIERGVIHNPEYYRWQREHGGQLPRQPGDEGCGGPVSIRRLIEATGVSMRRNSWPKELLELSNAHQLIQHIHAVELRTARTAVRDSQDTMGVRVDYLKGSLDDKEASDLVEKADRLRQRHGKAVNAWQLVSGVGQDLLRGLLGDLEACLVSGQSKARHTELIQTFLDQLEQLSGIANGLLSESIQGTGARRKVITRSEEGYWGIRYGC